MGLKAIVKKHWANMHVEPEKYQWIFAIYNRVLGRNKIRGKKGNRVCISCAKLDRNQIIFHGTDNEIIIEPGTQVWDCTFQIMGNHNRIVIGRDTFLICAELWISKDENRITVGKNSTIQGKLEYPIHLAAIEGTAIEIGQECMISAAVEIRTADGHSITNLEGKRINPSKSVRIGNHVWIGSGASCTKGIEITDHCIVGTKSVVTRSIEKSYCVVGGNPARIIKEGVDWQKELLEISE